MVVLTSRLYKELDPPSLVFLSLFLHATSCSYRLVYYYSPASVSSQIELLLSLLMAVCWPLVHVYPFHNYVQNLHVLDQALLALPRV